MSTKPSFRLILAAGILIPIAIFGQQKVGPSVGKRIEKFSWENNLAAVVISMNC